MTHCHNCGHTGTFVLLVQFALAVPGPDARAAENADVDRGNSPASADQRQSETDQRQSETDRRRRGTDGSRPESGGLSLSVQCPACDSTDVGVSPDDLLAHYGTTTTS